MEATHEVQVAEEREDTRSEGESGNEDAEEEPSGPAVPKYVLESLDRAADAVKELKTRLGHLLKLRDRCKKQVGRTSEDDEEMPPLNEARLNLVIAHTATTLYCLLLRTEGVAIEEREAVRKEVGRVIKYGKKVSAEEAEIKAAADGRSTQPGSNLDVAAVSRFVAGGLPDLSAEQRRKLREAGIKRKREQEEQKKREAERKLVANAANVSGGNEGGVLASDSRAIKSRAAKPKPSLQEVAKDFLAATADELNLPVLE